jgi:hypothetical protein
MVIGVVTDDEQDGRSAKAIGNCLVVTSTSCRIDIGAQTTYRDADPETTATST